MALDSFIGGGLTASPYREALARDEPRSADHAISLHPDPWMRWIYDPSHPEYRSDRAKDLRERRAAALRTAPQWMLAMAALNDAARKGEG